MKDKLKVAVAQMDIKWEDIPANLAYLDSMLNTLDNDVDVVVLPEMFTTGFTMSVETCAEATNGPTLEWMITEAKKINAAFTGSIIVKEASKYYNRMYWVYPTGEVKHYDKRHLFTYGNEEKFYEAGKKRVIVEYLGWRFNLNICYDLRFPVSIKNTGDYDVLINAASWPDVRISAWDILLQARAVENQAYVIGCTRVGFAPIGLSYVGHSAIVHCGGDYIHAPDNQEGIFYGVLDKNEMEELRSSFPVLKDARSFEFVD